MPSSSRARAVAAAAAAAALAFLPHSAAKNLSADVRGHWAVGMTSAASNCTYTYMVDQSATCAAVADAVSMVGCGRLRKMAADLPKKSVKAFNDINANVPGVNCTYGSGKLVAPIVVCVASAVYQDTSGNSYNGTSGDVMSSAAAASNSSSDMPAFLNDTTSANPSGSTTTDDSAAILSSSIAAGSASAASAAAASASAALDLAASASVASAAAAESSIIQASILQASASAAAAAQASSSAAAALQSYLEELAMESESAYEAALSESAAVAQASAEAAAAAQASAEAAAAAQASAEAAASAAAAQALQESESAAEASASAAAAQAQVVAAAAAAAAQAAAETPCNKVDGTLVPCATYATSDSPPDYSSYDLQTQCLALTQYARQHYNYGANSLSWDPILASYALYSASYAAYYNCWNCHTYAGGGYSWGQNLFLGEHDCQSAYNGWVTAEAAAENTASPEDGHFQNIGEMMPPESLYQYFSLVGFAAPYVSMGCAVATENGNTAVVCNYGLTTLSSQTVPVFSA
ncbi:hypothetical protein HDU84_008185 [Entophlyctis sp. JEL0112]|nr:hypothetical protein HDU84_008185 [Entophlyctis sp. JEL0112]